MRNFKNDFLEMTVISDREFRVDFCGHIAKYSSSAESAPHYFEEVKRKRLTAYELIPDGCVVIQEGLEPLLNGLFIGGVLEDSLRVVYGLGMGNRGIGGYSCSVFFLHDEKAIKEITNYRSLRGDFRVKGKQDE